MSVVYCKREKMMMQEHHHLFVLEVCAWLVNMPRAFMAPMPGTNAGSDISDTEDLWTADCAICI